MVEVRLIASQGPGVARETLKAVADEEAAWAREALEAATAEEAALREVLARER